MVFQSYALYPHMTVAQNIGFNLRLSGKTRREIDARVAEAARLLELTPLLSRRPYQLSGGQRQRVAMGRAIVRDPAVFLFDEPLSNLDAKLRVQMRTEIKTLHQKVQTTSIYVTHDQIEAMTLADRIAVLNGGRVEQQGSPIDLYSRPVNMFVAGFIGSPSMNFLEAVAVSGASGPKARLTDGSTLALGSDVAAREGQPLVVGLRPEHLSLTAEGGLGGRVLFVEPTGAQTHVTFDLAGQATVAVVDGMTPVSRGQTLSFAIPPNLVHVFDKTTGERL
jgi:multiple sugar transport system ATP-binding protein